MSEAHVTLAAEKIFSIGPIPITNTILTTWIVTLLLIAFAYFATRKISAVPSTLQNIAESMVEALGDLVSSVAGDKTKVFLPIVASFFFFTLLSRCSIVPVYSRHVITISTVFSSQLPVTFIGISRSTT